MDNVLTGTDFLLPSLGSDMESGTVTEWLVGIGDQVHKGDVLVRVDTEKAEIDVEIWHDAVIVELLVPVGEQVPVGTALARIDRTTNGAPAPDPDSAPNQVVAAADVPTAGPVAQEAASSPLAAAHVESAQSAPVQTLAAGPRLVYWPAPTSHATTAPRRPASPSASPRQSQPSDLRTRDERRQAAVAALMEQSNLEIPHFHLSREIDLTEALAKLEAQNEQLAPPDRVLPVALLLHGVAQAAHGSPVNGTCAESNASDAPVNLGVAVHLRGGGLVTPVIADAQLLSLDVTMSELRDKVRRARSGRMSASDLSEASLTVTNLGDAGADQVLGIIRPPQRSLVGFGTIRQLPRVVDSEVVVRSVVMVTLSADHRVVNGHAAARFLSDLNTHLSTWTPRRAQ